MLRSSSISHRYLALSFAAVAFTLAGVRADECPRAWRQFTAPEPTRPYELDYVAGAFDRARSIFVIFGGQAKEIMGETWELSGETWTQALVDGPAPRINHSMAYDSSAAKTVLFGGSNGTGLDHLFGDTWTWDGQSWSHAADSGPSKRSSTAMIFDESRGQTVLFGGGTFDDQGTRIYLGDTWIWDGDNWQELKINGPSPRLGARLAYDSQQQLVYLFGGSDGKSLKDVWTFDGAAWSQVQLSGDRPNTVNSVIYDDIADTFFIIDTSGTLQTNWSWDRQTWTKLCTGCGPGRFFRGAVAWDSSAHRLIYFGGDGFSSLWNSLGVEVPRSQTFYWDRSEWNSFPPVATLPGASFFSALTTPDGLQTCVFTGETVDSGGTVMSNEVHTCDADGWRLRAHVTPTARDADIPLTLTSSPVTIVFGGYAYNDDTRTWLWDGQDWTVSDPTGEPSKRKNYAACVDKNGDFLLFGGEAGSTKQADTWTWNPTNKWTRVLQNGPPKARRSASMTLDSNRGVVVMFGGFITSGGSDKAVAETWEWDGANWTLADDGHGPAAQTSARLVYDRVSKTVLLIDAGKTGHTMWSWNGSAWSRFDDAPQFPAGSRVIWDPTTNGVRVLTAGNFLKNVPTLTWDYAPVALGDCNCDGNVNFDDIDFFVAGIIGDESGYAALGGSASCWQGRLCWGDFEPDGEFNFLDIDGFVLALIGE